MDPTGVPIDPTLSDWKPVIIIHLVRANWSNLFETIKFYEVMQCQAKKSVEAGNKMQIHVVTSLSATFNFPLQHFKNLIAK